MSPYYSFLLIQGASGLFSTDIGDISETSSLSNTGVNMGGLTFGKLKESLIFFIIFDRYHIVKVGNCNYWYLKAKRILLRFIIETNYTFILCIATTIILPVVTMNFCFQCK